jgi:hypothetical protein
LALPVRPTHDDGVAAIEVSDGDATAVVSPADGGRLASPVIGGREPLVTDGLPLTVTSDADHWVICTPDHAVCVEPQTGPPDGPNSSPHVIEPGAPLSLTMTLTWTAPA